MLPLFSGPEHQKRRINLGGSSQHPSSQDLLNQVAAQRQNRLEQRRRADAALCVQSWWRGRRAAGVVRKALREEVVKEWNIGKMGMGSGVAGIRALRCVVVANWQGGSKEGDQLLRDWCDAVLEGGQAAVYASAGNDHEQSWFVLMSKIAKTMLASAASSPESDNSIRYLTILNYLLSKDAAISALGPNGGVLCQKMTGHLIDNGLYPSLSQAVKHIPVESKSSPALPLILNLITRPLAYSPPPSVVLSIFTHILTIPLLPNRLPLTSLPTFSSSLPFTRLDTIKPALLDALNTMSTEDKAHFLANMSMFVTPAYKAMNTDAFLAYLELSTVMINAIPPSALEKRPGDDGVKGKGKSSKGKTKKVTGKRKLLGAAGDAAGTSASESSRPQTPVPSGSGSSSTTRVVVVQEFSQPSSSTPALMLDLKTQTRILKLASPTHLHSIFDARQGKDYSKILRALVAYLFSLSAMVGSQGVMAQGVKDGAKDKDKGMDKAAPGGVVQFLAGGGGGAGFVRELWRECVRASPLGREGDGSTALFDDKNAGHWPPFLLLADVYSQTMLTMGDDEFFGTDSSSSYSSVPSSAFGGISSSASYSSGRTLGSSAAYNNSGSAKPSLGSLAQSSYKPGASATPAPSSAAAAPSSSSRTRNPLSLDELKTFSKKLLNAAFGLYWTDRAPYTSSRSVPGTGVSWEDARERLRVCVVGIRDRDSRRPFVPKDHWLVREMSMAGFVEAAVMEEQNLINAQFENEADSNAMDVDSPSSHHPNSHSNPIHSTSTSTSTSNPFSSSPPTHHHQHPAQQRLHRASRLNSQKLSLLTPRLLILNNLPFAIPFEVRVKIFRHFIVFDAMRHNGGGGGAFGGSGGFGGGPGSASGAFGGPGFGGFGGFDPFSNSVALNPVQRMRQGTIPRDIISGGGAEGDSSTDDDDGTGTGNINVGLGVNALGRMGRGRRREKVMIRRTHVGQDGFDKLGDVDLKRSVEIGFVDRFGEEE